MKNTLSIYDRLKSFTNKEETINELVTYARNAFDSNPHYSADHKFEDEPHIADWQAYVEESKHAGVFQTLQKYLVQFQFPIQEEISQTMAYKNACLRGRDTSLMQEASGLVLSEPEKLSLFIHSSIAGKIPILIANNRADFQAIVCALSCKNEPKPLPDSMGAAMIKGLNNWDRLQKLKQKWQQNQLLPSAPVKSNLLSDKSLYQDRIIVLSRTPYSNVSAKAMQLDQEKWIEASLKIRLDHECAHYFTLRYFGTMANNMHDEIIADYYGICSVLGQYNATWFLRFIGLENYPRMRPDGRLKNYLGKPPISVKAFNVLKTIVKRAAENIEEFEIRLGKARNNTDRQFRLLALCRLNLIELASEDGPVLLSNAYHKLQPVEYSHGS